MAACNMCDLAGCAPAGLSRRQLKRRKMMKRARARTPSLLGMCLRLCSSEFNSSYFLERQNFRAALGRRAKSHSPRPWGQLRATGGSTFFWFSQRLAFCYLINRQARLCGHWPLDCTVSAVQFVDVRKWFWYFGYRVGFPYSVLDWELAL